MIVLTICGCKLYHLSSNMHPPILRIYFNAIIDIERVNKSWVITENTEKLS